MFWLFYYCPFTLGEQSSAIIYALDKKLWLSLHNSNVLPIFIADLLHMACWFCVAVVVVVSNSLWFFSQVVYYCYAMSHCFFATLPHAQFDSHCCLTGTAAAISRSCRSLLQLRALFSTVLVLIKAAMRRCAYALAFSTCTRLRCCAFLSPALFGLALLNWFDWPLAFVVSINRQPDSPEKVTTIHDDDDAAHSSQRQRRLCKSVQE